MNKVMLVSYGFKNGEHRYDDMNLVIVQTEHVSDPEEDRKKAEVILKDWWTRQFNEADLIYVSAKTTIGGHLKAQLIEQPSTSIADHYDGESLSLDQIFQLIEETRPYTDFVVLKGLVSGDILQALDGPKYKFYVNTMQDPRTLDDYTVIKFKR